MAGIHITDIESAINYWRAHEPSPDGVALPAPTRALAEVYAMMVFHHETEADEASMPAKAHAAWLEWYMIGKSSNLMPANSQQAFQYSR